MTPRSSEVSDTLPPPTRLRRKEEGGVQVLPLCYQPRTEGSRPVSCPDVPTSDLFDTEGENRWRWSLPD